MKQSTFEATPGDSRYVPFTQQNYCCVPTGIQMIMYRSNIPLVPAEEIGYQLGLTVPPEDEHLFYKVRVAEKPPVTSGYGTNISEPEFEPNIAFQALGVPLIFSKRLATNILNEEELLKLLEDVETNDSDALICFNHGVAQGQYEPNSGHVVVFDRIINGQIRIVDPSPHYPKWRFFELSLLYDAIQQHGDENSGGIWYLKQSS